MTEVLKGKNLSDAQALFERFHKLITGHADSDLAGLGKLAVFSGVAEFPVRVKCASLAWHTLRSALEKRSEPVSTEV
jgi:nitrogen fixation NifU-like protein